MSPRDCGRDGLSARGVDVAEGALARSSLRSRTPCSLSCLASRSRRAPAAYACATASSTSSCDIVDDDDANDASSARDGGWARPDEDEDDGGRGPAKGTTTATATRQRLPRTAQLLLLPRHFRRS